MIKKLKKIIKILINYDDKKKENLKFNTDKFQIMHNSILSGDNQIGDYTYIGFNCIITQSVVGRYCSIANNVSIGIGEHKINRVSTSSLFYENPFETLTQGECIIANDVWIGSNAVIRRGVKIGNGAIIGANSFVNKDVNDFEIVGGVPAKLIKKRFDENTIKLIKESNWWDFDIENARLKISELELNNLFETN